MLLNQLLFFAVVGELDRVNGMEICCDANLDVFVGLLCVHPKSLGSTLAFGRRWLERSRTGVVS